MAGFPEAANSPAITSKIILRACRGRKTPFVQLTSAEISRPDETSNGA